MTWNVYCRNVATNMTKAEQKFRMVWKDDIPAYAGVEPNIEWKEVPWKKLEKRVFKLQKRIYKASSRGDVKTVRKLQKTAKEVLGDKMSSCPSSFTR